jgi:hypothetical protein
MGQYPRLMSFRCYIANICGYFHYLLRENAVSFTIVAPMAATHHCCGFHGCTISTWKRKKETQNQKRVTLSKGEFLAFVITIK